MNVAEMEDVGRRYEARFGGLDELVHPSIMFEQQFLDLLQNALDTNSPLTRERVDQIFPSVPWEE